MEYRAHRSRVDSVKGQMSRIERDLSASPHNTAPSDPNGHQPRMLRRILSPGRIPHVCVVGAGMAGLRCAEVLIKHGFKVTILEGRNRIGGRVHQSNHLGHLVDEGPNWIHGTNQNPILDLAVDTKTTTYSIGERQSVFDSAGRVMDEKTATEYSEIVWGVIADAFKYSKEHSAEIPPDKSLMDFFLEKLKEKDVSQDEQTILLQMAQMWGAFVGDPIGKQSLKFFWLEECIEGENLFVASTYKAILDCVAETALTHAEIHFSNTVTSIESSASPTNDTNPRTVLRTSSGSAHTFDEVVLTAPLGWLKRNKPAFTPQLPPRIAQAINNISYGRLEKVYITFRTAFWDSPPSTTESTSDTPIPLSTPSPSTSRLPTTTHSTPPTTHYPGFTHFLHPNYAPLTNPSHWNQELVNLASLPTHTAHPTLLFYIYGPCAEHVASLTSHHARDSYSYLRTLADFFRPYYSRLPHFSPQNPNCHPIKALATQWAADPLAGWGSYCNFQISSPSSSSATAGSDSRDRGRGASHAGKGEQMHDGKEHDGEGNEGVELDKDIEALRAGMPDRGVWLAGEHTAPFVALGTVTGAWWSGEGVGRRIVAAYGYGSGQGKEQEHEQVDGGGGL